MAGLLGGLLSGLLGSGAGDPASLPASMNATKDQEDAVTSKVADKYLNSQEPSSTMAQNGVSNVISQDQRLQLISPNQMVHTDFCINPDIAAFSRQSNQLLMNQAGTSTNEVVFEFASNQTLVFLKDLRLEMELTVGAEEVIGIGNQPINIIAGGQYWWTQFFSQVRVEINGNQVAVTDINAFRAICAACDVLNPNNNIGLGAVRKHIDAETRNSSHYYEEVNWEVPPGTPGTISYINKTLYKKVYLPLTMFDIKDLLAPNTILRITFVKNNNPVTLIGSHNQGSYTYGTACKDSAEARVLTVTQTNLSMWLTTFEVNPEKARADQLPLVVSGSPNQIVWYLPQTLSFGMTGGAYTNWATYANPAGAPYGSFTQEFLIQGTGVIANNYVAVPEVTWQVWIADEPKAPLPAAAPTPTNTNLTWTEIVPGLCTMEKVSINSQDINYPSSVLPVTLMSAVASGTFNGYMELLDWRARSAISERYSGNQLSYGTYKKLKRRLTAERGEPIGGSMIAPLVTWSGGAAPTDEQVAAAVTSNLVSMNYAQRPWEKLRDAPMCIINTVLNEDPTVIITPQRGTLRITLRFMSNFMAFASMPTPGTVLPLPAAVTKFNDNPNTNTPYLPYWGQSSFQLDNTGNAVTRRIILKNPTLNVRFVAFNITSTEYGSSAMTVTNTNLYEKIGGVGGL
jgi:hypothetical protein